MKRVITIATLIATLLGVDATAWKCGNATVPTAKYEYSCVMNTSTWKIVVGIQRGQTVPDVNWIPKFPMPHK